MAGWAGLACSSRIRTPEESPKQAEVQVQVHEAKGGKSFAAAGLLQQSC